MEKLKIALINWRINLNIKIIFLIFVYFFIIICLIKNNILKIEKKKFQLNNGKKIL